MSYQYEKVGYEDEWEVSVSGGDISLGLFQSKQEAIDHIHYLNGGGQADAKIVTLMDSQSYDKGFEAGYKDGCDQDD